MIPKTSQKYRALPQRKRQTQSLIEALALKEAIIQINKLSYQNVLFCGDSAILCKQLERVTKEVAAALAGCSPLQLAWVTDRFLLGDVVSVRVFVKSLIMRLTEGEKKTLASNLIRIPSTVNHHRFDL
ncbi:unnamed protein product [Brassica rapa subsp. trilocularis]